MTLAAVWATPVSYASSSPGRQVLYSQMGHFYGEGIVSQVFHGENAGYRSLAADDFTVPGGQTWVITRVTARGVYHESGGRASNVLVTFYAAGQDKPAEPIARAVVFHPQGPFFRLPLHRDAVTLVPGQYWVSVQVLGADDGRAPFWTWSSETDSAGTPAVWRNPPDGFGSGCVNWEPTKRCAAPEGLGPNFMFVLAGTSS